VLQNGGVTLPVLERQIEIYINKASGRSG
jgi:hypothetical protein